MELFEPKNSHIMNIIFGSFHDFVNQVFINIMESYKENNSL